MTTVKLIPMQAKLHLNSYIVNLMDNMDPKDVQEAFKDAINYLSGPDTAKNRISGKNARPGEKASLFWMILYQTEHNEYQQFLKQK